MNHIIQITLSLLLFMIAGCETQPKVYGPAPTPIQTQPQTQPISGRGDLPPATSVIVETPEIEQPLPTNLPISLTSQPVLRAAVVLPLAHQNARINAEAEGIYNGIEMAMFDHANENFVVVSYATNGSVEETRAAFSKALNDGAGVIIGPLTSQNTMNASGLAARQGVPVLAFTNNARAAQSGANLVSLVTSEDVRHMVQYAVQKGVTGFGFIGPDTAYGRQVEAALRQNVALAGRSLVASEFYNPRDQIPSDAAERFVSSSVDYATASPRQFAVLIPDSGVKLRSVATLLPYFGLNERNTVFMGTRVWNDPSVWREPVLTGGVFPLADPASVGEWTAKFTRIFGGEPARLAGFGYDAGKLAIDLLQDEEAPAGYLQNISGFEGVQGTYRFRPDRTAERNLAIMRITSEGSAEVAVPPAVEFLGNF